MKLSFCRIIFNVIILLLFILPNFSYSNLADENEGAWKDCANLNSPRAGLSSVVVNNQIYAIGGLTWDEYYNEDEYSYVERYDPLTDAWVYVAEMPINRSYFSCTVWNNKIFVFGANAQVDCYNPINNSWFSCTEMMTKRHGLICETVNNEIYVITGFSLAEGGYISDVECYNPLTNSWLKRANIPTPRRYAASAVVDNKIYVIGGYNYDNGGTLSTVECYDPSTNTWSTLKEMPTPRKGLTCEVIDNKIFTFGGIFNNLPMNTVEYFDTLQNKWFSCEKLPTKRGFHSSAVNDKLIYIIGGRIESANPISKVESYDSTNDLSNDPKKSDSTKDSSYDPKKSENDDILLCFIGIVGVIISIFISLFLIRKRSKKLTSLDYQKSPSSISHSTESSLLIKNNSHSKKFPNKKPEINQYETINLTMEPFIEKSHDINHKTFLNTVNKSVFISTAINYEKAKVIYNRVLNEPDAKLIFIYD